MKPGCITFQSVRTAKDVLDLGCDLRRMYEAVKELVPIMAAARKIAEAFREFLDGIFQKINPKSYHLYKHAKKARVRNKNKNRLLKLFGVKKE